MTIQWWGAQNRESYNHDHLAHWDAIDEAARTAQWHTVIALIGHRSGQTTAVDDVNGHRIGAMPCSTPLHHAASHGAPADVVQHLIQLGAWRSLRDTNGDTPLELAAQRGHRHLYELLTPLTHHHFPAADLAQLDHILHAVIVGRAHHLVRRARLRLPQLEPLTELESPQPQMWCPVPGMYGGFDIVLQTTTGHTELLVESWSRVNGGSGREHHVTTTGYRVISQGFV